MLKSSGRNGPYKLFGGNVVLDITDFQWLVKKSESQKIEAPKASYTHTHKKHQNKNIKPETEPFCYASSSIKLPIHLLFQTFPKRFPPNFPNVTHPTNPSDVRWTPPTGSQWIPWKVHN